MKKVFHSFIKNPRKTSYEGKDADEKIIVLLRKTFFHNYVWIMITIILAIVPLFLFPSLSKLAYNGIKLLNPGFILVLNIFWYTVTVGFAFQSFLSWYFDVLMVTNKKIIDIDQSGRHVSETTLSNVQDVTSKIKGNLGVVLDIGDIYIQTSGEQREFEFLYVDNPSKVRDEISDLIAEIKKKNGY